jgi:hypothetical protein
MWGTQEDSEAVEDLAISVTKEMTALSLLFQLLIKRRVFSKDACFLSYTEDRSKDIHKNKLDHIQTQL